MNSLNENILRQIPLFQALDEKQLKGVLKSSHVLSLAAKSSLFERGSVASHFYLLKSGQIKLFCLSEEGDEKEENSVLVKNVTLYGETYKINIEG